MAPSAGIRILYDKPWFDKIPGKRDDEYYSVACYWSTHIMAANVARLVRRCSRPMSAYRPMTRSG